MEKVMKVVSEWKWVWDGEEEGVGIDFRGWLSRGEEWGSKIVRKDRKWILS